MGGQRTRQPKLGLNRLTGVVVKLLDELSSGSSSPSAFFLLCGFILLFEVVMSDIKPVYLTEKQVAVMIGFSLSKLSPDFSQVADGARHHPDSC